MKRTTELAFHQTSTPHQQDDNTDPSWQGFPKWSITTPRGLRRSARGPRQLKNKLGFLRPSGRVVAYHASTPQGGRGSRTLYASETWTLNLETIRALKTFERKALRTIFGPVKDQGCWRTRYNFELYRLYKEPQVILKSSEADWNPGKLLVSRTLLESPEVLLQGCGIDSKNVRRRPGAGRPRATTSTDDRYTQLTTRRNRTENATQLCSRPQDEGCSYVSASFYARRPIVCIPLTPRHRVARRRWAAEHRDWEQHDWSHAVYRRVPIQSRV
ncbi:uncharacterized protein TNCV_2048391 [Trichonephila clavipes]|nr:uncharacterized protein TNCV_2048391 [Trichonephila clavipes]